MWPRAERVETIGDLQIGYYREGGKAWQWVHESDGKLRSAQAWYPGGVPKIDIEYRDGKWYRTRVWNEDGTLNQDVVASRWIYP